MQLDIKSGLLSAILFMCETSSSHSVNPSVFNNAEVGEFLRFNEFMYFWGMFPVFYKIIK